MGGCLPFVYIAHLVAINQCKYIIIHTGKQGGLQKIFIEEKIFLGQEGLTLMPKSVKVSVTTERTVDYEEFRCNVRLFLPLLWQRCFGVGISASAA